ncbi:hypothetical protein PUN28_003548 [Cardiocondyla obscurior]|uniref:Uncharacterized protein n=1 Tax=Cardiocondyla obscurior TaxID=286306 RepID=A0AAW2GNN9_9HYME
MSVFKHKKVGSRENEIGDPLCSGVDLHTRHEPLQQRDGTDWKPFIHSVALSFSPVFDRESIDHPRLTSSPSILESRSLTLRITLLRYRSLKSFMEDRRGPDMKFSTILIDNAKMRTWGIYEYNFGYYSALVRATRASITANEGGIYEKIYNLQ